LYAQLREDILSGRLEPGRRLSGEFERLKLMLADAACREAVARLRYDGLVDVCDDGELQVSRISLQDVREGFFIRNAIEPPTAAEAAARGSECGIYELRQCLKRMRTMATRDDRAGYFAADVVFHELIAESIKFRSTIAIVRGLRAPLDRVRRLLVEPRTSVDSTLVEHDAIFAAIESRNPEAARSAMAAHLKSTVDRFEREVALRPDIFSAQSANGAPV
jgi:GntR family transcriptional regulator, rspAB operon transcriptional repressor